MPLYDCEAVSDRLNVSILSSPGMVCHIVCLVPVDWAHVSFLSCHHQEWYATQQGSSSEEDDVDVSILSSPGMVCHCMLFDRPRSSLKFLSCHHQEWYATGKK